MGSLDAPVTTQSWRPPQDSFDGSLLRVVEQMRADPSVAVRTEHLARALGVAPFVMIRAFSRLTGLSPQRFRSALRIARAKELLVETDRPITEISLDVGYSSLGTFVRIFTMLIGVSPGQLRRFARSEMPKPLPFSTATLPRDTHSSGSGISGRIIGTFHPTTTLAAGIFERGLPAGIPLDGQILDPSDTRFSLDLPIKRGRSCLLVASVGQLTWSDAWIGRYTSLRVARIELSARPTGPLTVDLRATLPSDPPFLTPLPLLKLLQPSLRGV